MNKKIAILAVVVVAIVAIIGGIVLVSRFASSADMKTAGEVAPPKIQPDAKPPIKVGITVSLLTSKGSGPSGKLFGFNTQLRLVRDFALADMELYPVIEPGSEADETLAAALQANFPDHKPIHGGDPDALGKLDVLVANAYWNCPDDMLKSMDTAVARGLSLLNGGGIGWASPGFRQRNPSPLRLAGFVDGQGGFTDATVECEVVATQEITGEFATEKTMMLKPQGAYGTLPADAMPLIRVKDMSAVHARGPGIEPNAFVLYPVYISHLEKGKIVGITVNQEAALWIRSIRWLAGRPVQ